VDWTREKPQESVGPERRSPVSAGSFRARVRLVLSRSLTPSALVTARRTSSAAVACRRRRPMLPTSALVAHRWPSLLLLPAFAVNASAYASWPLPPSQTGLIGLCATQPSPTTRVSARAAASTLAPVPPPLCRFMQPSHGLFLAAVTCQYLMLTCGLLHSRLHTISPRRLRARALPSRPSPRPMPFTLSCHRATHPLCCDARWCICTQI
jgi:hypothetical protein